MASSSPFRRTLLLVALTPLFAMAQPAPEGTTVKAERAWARATPPQQRTSSGYVVLTSPVDDVLLSASSPVVGHAELHEMKMERGAMQMRELSAGVRLPQGERVGLMPGGYHIMLMDLRRPLVAGQTIPLELRFKRSPPLQLEFQVLPIGSSGPDAATPQ